MSGQSASPERPPTSSLGDLIKWLFRLSVRVRLPAHVESKLEDAIKAHANSLADYPPHLVETTLDDWPDRHAWWPTWQELHEELGPARKFQPPVLPEHRMLNSPYAKREDASLHRPFTADERRDFEDAMAALRSGRPCWFREHWLRIGEKIEARQRVGASP